LWRAGFVTADTPVLLMAGEMDSVTPVQWAQDVTSGLVNARVVAVPYLAHFPGGLANMDCYDRIIAGFFEAGSAAGLDLSCIASMKPPAFEAPRKP
ncbi:MAG: alpha/beta hydrolase, partial [Gammaproteobacteria bacterium]